MAHFSFDANNHIYRTAEVRVANFCILVELEYPLSSFSLGMTHYSLWAWSGSSDNVSTDSASRGPAVVAAAHELFVILTFICL